MTVGDDTPIELLGGTHNSNTAEAEASILVQETAIAKGIRRISAVIKDAARQAIKKGEKFKSVAADTAKLATDTPDLGKTTSAIRKDLNAAFLSAPLKAELRGRVEGIQKKANEAKKAVLAQRVDRCLNDVKIDVEAVLAEGKKSLVLNVDISRRQGLAKVVNAVQSIAPDNSFWD